MITEAGTHERVTALVYVAGFMPDAGESVNTLLAGFPTDGPQPPILPPVQGFLFLDREKFHESFAATSPLSRRHSSPTPKFHAASMRDPAAVPPAHATRSIATCESPLEIAVATRSVKSASRASVFRRKRVLASFKYLNPLALELVRDELDLA